MTHPKISFLLEGKDLALVLGFRCFKIFKLVGATYDVSGRGYLLFYVGDIYLYTP